MSDNHKSEYNLTQLWWTLFVLPIALGIAFSLTMNKIGMTEFLVISGIVSAWVLIKNTFIICRVIVKKEAVQIDCLFPLRRIRAIPHAQVSSYNSFCVKTAKRGLEPVHMTLSLKEGSSSMSMGGMKNPAELDDVFMRIYPNASREVRTPAAIAKAVRRSSTASDSV